MSIGMSYDEYWYANPYLVRDYYEAHKLRITQRNQEMWMQGMYFAEAINCTIGNIGNKGKKNKYPEEPYDLFPNKSKEEQERIEQKEREKAIASFMRLQGSLQTKLNGDTKCQ